MKTDNGERGGMKERGEEKKGERKANGNFFSRVNKLFKRREWTLRAIKTTLKKGQLVKRLLDIQNPLTL